MMELFAAHPQHVDLSVLWPHIEHFVDDACKSSHGEITPQALKHAIETQECQLWVVVDTERNGPARFRAIVGTQLSVVMSGAKVCNIIFCAGTGRKTWLHLLDKLADWSRSEGCIKLRGFMRKGWARDLPTFKIVANVMEMDLADVRRNHDKHHEAAQAGMVAQSGHSGGGPGSL